MIIEWILNLFKPEQSESIKEIELLPEEVPQEIKDIIDGNEMQNQPESIWDGDMFIVDTSTARPLYNIIIDTLIQKQYDWTFEQKKTFCDVITIHHPNGAFSITIDTNLVTSNRNLSKENMINILKLIEDIK